MERSIYLGYSNQIENIAVNDALCVNEIIYGEDLSIETVQQNDLLFLGKNQKLPRAFVASEGKESLVLKSLFSKREIRNLETNKKLHFPRTIKIKGQKSQLGTSVAAYICTDIFYFQDYDYNLKVKSFQINCLLGRGGISEFVDRYGNFQNKNIFVIGNGLGAIAALVVVEFENEKPVHRSRYVILARAGIRYPDDLWRSKITGKPLTSIQEQDISGARFIFQSRQPNGSGTDIFVSNFNGENMYNLTWKNESAYDGFFDDDGNEVAKWIDQKTIQYCSMTKGRREIKKAIDPLYSTPKEEKMSHPLKVFLCYSSDDKNAVRLLFQRLRSEGFDTWFDEEALLPGQDWDLEITKAVRTSHVAIVCLSRASINKTGYVQKEIKTALDVADEQPEGTVFLIPLKLEECTIPERLRRWQYVNYFEEGSYERLIRTLRARTEKLGLSNSLT